MGRNKGDKNIDEESIRMEFKFSPKVIEYLKRYQVQHNIEGSLQKVAELAMMRELTSDNLVQRDKDLINKISHIKTLGILSDRIHLMKPTHYEIYSTRQTMNFLLDFGKYCNPPIIDEYENELLYPSEYKKRKCLTNI